MPAPADTPDPWAERFDRGVLRPEPTPGGGVGRSDGYDETPKAADWAARVGLGMFCLFVELLEDQSRPERSSMV